MNTGLTMGLFVMYGIYDLGKTDDATSHKKTVLTASSGRFFNNN